MPHARAFVVAAAVILACGLAAARSEAAPTANAITPGYLSTRQSKIVDVQGREIRILGLNWFGFETPDLTPQGLQFRSYRDMLDQMASLGFNTIRLPFTTAVLTAGADAVRTVRHELNPDLEGKAPLEIMDAVIDYAGVVGMRVILDYQSLVPIFGTRTEGAWSSATHSEADWISGWETLAKRYAGNPTVIGADLFNQPAGTWGTGEPDDWARAAKAAGDAIHRVNPNWLIIVQGLRVYNMNYYWWGGQLEAVLRYPIRLARSGKLVYSAHDYAASLFQQPWFYDSRYPANLRPIWDRFWGFIETKGIAPVLLGEFGSPLDTVIDRRWAKEMRSYLAARGVDWIWWSWNGNGEPSGLLLPDWQTVDPNIRAYLTDLMAATRR